MNANATSTVRRSTLPDGTVRIPDRLFADLQRDAESITVMPNGSIVLHFVDGDCVCERNHPKNVNQWTVTQRLGRSPLKTKDTMTKEQRAEVARLRKSLNDGRREFRVKLRELNVVGNQLWKKIKLVETECRSVQRDLEVFEAKMNRQIEQASRS